MTGSGPVPWDTCGYTPAQLRSAYNLGGQIPGGGGPGGGGPGGGGPGGPGGSSGPGGPPKGGPGGPGGPQAPQYQGKGVTIADVLWFDSPTITSDLNSYFDQVDPHNPLEPGQFKDEPLSSVSNVAACGGGGVYTEQALDLEAYHAVAPAADLQYVGATDCTDASLITAEQQAVTGGANVVSNSWSSSLGDVFESPSSITAYEDVFTEAETTGVTVLFSSGDTGDNVATFGLQIPDYPSDDPLVTSVGGTSVQIDQQGSAAATYGWSSAISNLTNGAFPSVAFYAGSGGGTSYNFLQPSYQAGVVPEDIAERNAAVDGPVPTRVDPDISMDADPLTGMLIGLTQAFPDGDHFGTFDIGGTSLAAPLLAGATADADSAIGGDLGFLNPLLYGNYAALQQAGALEQVDPSLLSKAGAAQGTVVNSKGDAGPVITSFAAFNYEGQEQYCDGTGNCSTQDTALDTGPGFNSMTGLGTLGANFVATLAQAAHSAGVVKA